MGSPYGANAAAVMLSGGNGFLPPLLDVTDQNGRNTNSNMLMVLRQNGTASATWRAGGVPRLNLALQQDFDANAFENYGVLNFGGEMRLRRARSGFPVRWNQRCADVLAA